MASRGDATYAQKRLDEITDFTVLEVNGEIEDLARGLTLSESVAEIFAGLTSELWKYRRKFQSNEFLILPRKLKKRKRCS